MNYTDLLSIVGDVHNVALRGTAKVVNQLHVLRNWTVGCLIFEFEQSGEDRAAYGEGLLKRLGADLASKGLMGLGLSNLKNCRTFYRLYPQIGQMASGQFGDLLTQLGKSQTPSGLLPPDHPESSDSSPATLSSRKEPPSLPAEILLRLSWSQFVEFIRLDDPWKRAFYENECCFSKLPYSAQVNGQIIRSVISECAPLSQQRLKLSTAQARNLRRPPQRNQPCFVAVCSQVSLKPRANSLLGASKLCGNLVGDFEGQNHGLDGAGKRWHRQGGLRGDQTIPLSELMLQRGHPAG